MINWLTITTLTGSLVVLFILLFKKMLVKRLGGFGYYLVCVITLILFVLPVRIPISADVNFNVTDSMPVTQATNEGGMLGKLHSTQLQSFKRRHLKRWRLLPGLAGCFQN